MDRSCYLETVRVKRSTSRCLLLLVKLTQRRFRVFQILGVEAFGEPVVNRFQQIECFFAFVLALPKSCKTGRRTQFP